MSNARQQFSRRTAQAIRMSVILAVGIAGAASSVTAQIPAPAPSPVPAPATSTTVATHIPCQITGRASMLFGVHVYDQAIGGDPIARFTGARSALRVLELPRSAEGRALVETGTGQGQFRVRGYVPVKELPLYANRPVPVVPSHVWIGAGHPIQFRNADAETITVEKRMEFPFNQAFVARTSCAALALEPTRTTPAEIPGNARGYVLEKESLELFDRPSRGAEAIMWLQRGLVEPGPLFWSDESKGGWVHIELHGAVDISGWAKKSALRRLPKGELVDQFPPPALVSTGPRLKLADGGTLVKVPAAIDLLGAAKKKAKTIGQIEAGTEVIIVDRVAQWVSVMPNSMHLAPPEGRQFWASAAAIRPAK